MTVVSHFMLPVIAAGCLELSAVRRSGRPLFGLRGLALVGFCGTLPDLLTPHLSLGARYTSWSHTLWFLAAVLLLGLALARMLEPRRRAVVWMCLFAVFLHLLCDMVSGGVNLLPGLCRPLGGYYFPARYWLWLDLASLVAAYLVCRHARQALASMIRVGKPAESM